MRRRVWLFDPATDATAKVCRSTCPRIARRPRASSWRAGEFLGGFDVHPAGHSLALDVRGKLFTMGLWEGAVRQRGMPDGARHRHAQWLADGATVVAVSDETGEERVQAWKDGATRSLPWDIGRVDRDARGAAAAASSPSPTTATR